MVIVHGWMKIGEVGVICLALVAGKMMEMKLPVMRAMLLVTGMMDLEGFVKMIGQP